MAGSAQHPQRVIKEGLLDDVADRSRIAQHTDQQVDVSATKRFQQSGINAVNNGNLQIRGRSVQYSNCSWCQCLLSVWQASDCDARPGARSGFLDLFNTETQFCQSQFGATDQRFPNIGRNQSSLIAMKQGPADGQLQLADRSFDS